MNKFLLAFIAALCSLWSYSQQAPLPTSLTIAAKEGLQKLEEQKQEDIIFYSKNNTPEQNDVVAVKDTSGNFYEVFTKDPNNIYYNTYYKNNSNNTDPILVNMPAPGPNLNYWLVDPNSSGNYDKVVPQK